MKSNARPWPFQPMDNINLASEYDCPAIKRCSQAWYRAFRDAQAKGTNPVSVRLRANEAYRYAMPPLNSPENIRDFLACVVHGMMVGCIIVELGSVWIRAARAAAGMYGTKLSAPSRGGGPASPAPSAPQPDDDFDDDKNSDCETVRANLIPDASSTCTQKPSPRKREQ